MVRKKHFACVIGLFCLLVSLRVFADDRSDAAELINSAEATFQRFVADPEMGCFLGNVADAKALVIVPQLLKVGFINSVDPLDVLVRQRMTSKNADRLRDLVFKTTVNKRL